jgi:hypothetical protein
MLHYIRGAHLPVPPDTKPSTYHISKRAARNINWLCGLYQVYISLGMHYGGLQYQPNLVKEINEYFPGESEIKAEEVVQFWWACKADCVLTWRVLDWVLGCTRNIGMEVERLFGRYLEQDPELRFLWEVSKQVRDRESRL